MLWLLSLLPLLAAGFFVAYRLSPASAASKRASKAVAALESLDSELKKQQQDIDSSLSQAASNYVREIQMGRLRSIQLDELKRHASGMRLQALKDVGIRTLADLLGWNEGRLSNVRGVGPKSASAIARVASQLTRASNAVSVPVPTPPFASERDRILLQSIYRDCWFDTHLSEQRRAFDETLQNCETSLLQIRENTRFSRWLRGFGGTEVVKSGIAVAETLCDGLGAYGHADKLSQGLSKGLAECRAVCSNRIESDVLFKDYLAKQPVYDWLLAKSLGHSNSPRPRPVASSVHEYDPALPSASVVGMSSRLAITPPRAGAIEEKSSRGEGDVAHMESGRRGPSAIQAGEIGEHSNVKLLADAGEQAQRWDTQSAAQDHGTPTSDAQYSGGGIFVVEGNSSEKLITVRVGGDFHPRATEFALPTPAFRKQSAQVRWLQKGEEIRVQGFTITTGFLFYGESANGLEQSVIEPLLPAKRNPEAPSEVPSYCNSYAALTPDLRYRYLEWLSNGARDNADSGFGMLYFLGLERRLLEMQNAEESPAVVEDRGKILEELGRIRDLFIGTRGAVSYYARLLIEFISARTLLGSPNPELPGAWERSFEVPFYLRFGLGCYVRDKQPIPVDWALRWAYVTPTIYLRTPARRCRKEFEAAFAHNYRERFGTGLVIPRNKTILKLTYRPAGHFSQDAATSLVFSAVPDVGALTAPQQALREVVEQSTTMIEAYSRFVGRDASRSEVLEALLNLPVVLWPEASQIEFREFQASFVEPLQADSCATVFQGLGISGEITPARITEVARGLQRLCIGFEPDVLAGARRPKRDDPVVLFRLSSAEDIDRSDVLYKNATLTVTLAAIVALADGHASDSELVAINQMILTWTHLSLDLRTRLQAQYRLQVRQPATLTSLKSKLTSLGAQDRMQVASILASLATVDGVVSPAEVKLLEQVYRILELDPQALYSRLHGGIQKEWKSADALPSFPGANNSAPLLDKGRITELRRETDQVMELLTPVFADDDPEVTSEHNGAESPDTILETDVAYCVLPELSMSDHAFLTLLLGKSEWSRAELLHAATEMQIMLDGTLERINEAALDHFGDALVEGDDPICVQQTILETTE